MKAVIQYDVNGNIISFARSKDNKKVSKYKQVGIIIAPKEGYFVTEVELNKELARKSPMDIYRSFHIDVKKKSLEPNGSKT